MRKSSPVTNSAAQCPPEQVTLVYRNRHGSHSFSILEVPGLVVLDHDLEKAFHAGVKGASKLVSAVCKQPVQYEVDMSFRQFKNKIEKQLGTANKDQVVAVLGKIQHRAEATA